MSKDPARYSVQPVAPRAPRHRPPPGACDTHAHIFPEREFYPIADPSMAVAPVALYREVHARLGIARGVLVQGGAYRHDNSAMLDALARFPAELRGVALVTPDIAEAEIDRMVELGVRAFRFTQGGASRLDMLPLLAPAMRARGMHAEMYVGTAEFRARADELLKLGLPLVLDHLGGPYAGGADVNDEAFRFLLARVRDDNVWIKLTPQRNAIQIPSYADARGCFDALVQAAPERMIWGSDWPFPNMGARTPDVADLLDLFFDWVADTDLRQRILVDNAARLYRF